MVQAFLEPPEIEYVPWNTAFLNEQYLIRMIYFLWKVLIVLEVVEH